MAVASPVRHIRHVLLVVTLCAVLLGASSDCCGVGRHAAEYSYSYLLRMEHRKILLALEKYRVPSPSGTGVDVKSISGELRRVPSGPDPLHHHKGGPQKPQTP